MSDFKNINNYLGNTSLELIWKLRIGSTFKIFILLLEMFGIYFNMTLKVTQAFNLYLIVKINFVSYLRLMDFC